jgi:3'-phosphoadenosine 5'-phosphosulfate sulfotransferase (PAPS reductase)/FAD synthetase
MALRLAEVESRDYEYVITPTGRELPTMLAHWMRLEDMLGKPLIRVTNQTLDYWIREWKALPNFRMRWCTRVLKIEPMMAYLLRHAPVTHYVGLRADEETREGIYGEVAAFTRHPLREWGWGKAEVIAYNTSRGIKIPPRTDCDICFFQRIKEWKSLDRLYPDLYAEGVAYEELTGATFRTPGRDSWPTSLADLRAEFARQPDLLMDDEPTEACRACTL